MPSAKELAKALAYQGEIRNTSRNRLLGGVADFLAPVSEFADRDKLPESIPLLGGMSFADLSGLKGSQSLVNDMSYGKSPVRGATLNTAKVDPRVLDLAGVSGAMIPVGKALGKAALREAAKQVQSRTGFARFMPDTRTSVVPEGASMPQRPKTEFEILHDTAQRNAALPVEQGGLGLPSGNTAMDRAGAMGFDTPAYHGRVMDDLENNAIPAAKRGGSVGHAYLNDDPNVTNAYAMTTTPTISTKNINTAKKIKGYSPTSYPLMVREGRGLNEGNDIHDVIDTSELADSLSEYSSELDNREILDQKDIQEISNKILNNFTAEYSGSSMPTELGQLFGYLEDTPSYRKNLTSKFDSVSFPDLEAGGRTIVPFQPSQIRSRFAAFDPMRRHEADILAGVGVGGMLDPQAIAEALRQQDRK